MKESLDLESRDSLVAYRIERAYDSLKEAKLIAQGILMLAVWLYVVYEQDWNFKIVTIDSFMMSGWTASFYFFPFYFISKLVLKILNNRPKVLRNIRIAFNLFVFFAPVIIVIAMSVINSLYS